MPADTVAFLSDDWLVAADRLLSAVAVDPPLDGPPLTLETVVTDAPPGRGGYVIEIDGARWSARRVREDEETSVRFTQRYTTAVAVAVGELSAQAAFLAADIGLGGDVALLIAHAGLVAGAGDVLAPLRAETTYETTDETTYETTYETTDEAG